MRVLPGTLNNKIHPYKKIHGNTNKVQSGFDGLTLAKDIREAAHTACGYKKRW